MLFLLITAISLFIPSHIRISKAINVQTPVDSIFEQIDDIHQWKNWYPPFKNDTLSKLQEKKSENGKLVTAVLNNTSIGLHERKDDEITATMQTADKNPVTSSWKVITYPHSDSTTIQWYLDFKLKWYPWEKFSSLLYEKMYGVQLEEGLANLKSILQSDRTSTK
ncbi:MAG: SRPBCC family protein [Bacteroidetes bacterium]|nr:SRPBCC family protein [Bacteroidota bacterium]